MTIFSRVTRVAADPDFQNAARFPIHRKPGALAALPIVILALTGIGPVLTEAGTLKHHGSRNNNTAQAGITFSPASLSFNTTVGQTDVQTVTLTNTGTAALQLNSAAISGNGFSLTGLTLPMSVSVGQRVSFTVKFTPASAATISGGIAFSDNAPASPQTFRLTGTATAATLSLAASPGNLNFGNVQTGSSTSLTTTLTNLGNSDVTISGMTVSGVGYGASGATSGMILSPSQSITLSVTFAPTALGTIPGTVKIASNATNSPTTISLSGESHTVMLSWTASSGVAGYYIYRATAAGSYTKASSLIGSNQYTDTAVQAGTTYSYVVTAVDSNGAESSYSTPITVSVP